MESDIEYYCCRESKLILESILGETEKKCVIEVDTFKKIIEQILELQSKFQQVILAGSEGKVVSTSLCYICSLRLCGKGRRYMLYHRVLKNGFVNFIHQEMGIFQTFSPENKFKGLNW